MCTGTLTHARNSLLAHTSSLIISLFLLVSTFSLKYTLLNKHTHSPSIALATHHTLHRWLLLPSLTHAFSLIRSSCKAVQVTGPYASISKMASKLASLERNLKSSTVLWCTFLSKLFKADLHSHSSSPASRDRRFKSNWLQHSQRRTQPKKRSQVASPGAASLYFQTHQMWARVGGRPLFSPTQMYLRQRDPYAAAAAFFAYIDKYARTLDTLTQCSQQTLTQRTHNSRNARN